MLIIVHSCYPIVLFFLVAGVFAGQCNAAGSPPDDQGTVLMPIVEGHAMVCRTAPKLAGPWSDPPSPVKTEGNPESPFLTRRGPHYYLFQQMEVFLSDRPTHFGGEPLTHMTGIWYGGKWAPEVISDNGEDYLAGYGRGLWVARLKWVEMTRSEAEAHARPVLEKVRAGRAAAEKRRRDRERQEKVAD